MLIVQFTGVALIFYLVMIYLTFDRFMEIALNIKYPLYWSRKKANRLLIATWIISGTVATIVCLARGLVNFNWEPYVYIYFFPTMEIAFLVLAITTYSFIFKKFRTTRIFPALTSTTDPLPVPSTVEREDEIPDPKQSRKSMAHQERRRRRSSIYIFRRSKFFIPALLILTFLVFMASADLALMFATVTGQRVSEELTSFVFISYAISNLCDAVIYIFLQKDVRGLLYRKIRYLSS